MEMGLKWKMLTAVRKTEFQGLEGNPNIHQAGMISFPAMGAGMPATPAPRKGFVTGLATCSWFKGMAGNEKWILEGDLPQQSLEQVLAFPWIVPVLLVSHIDTGNSSRPL